MLRAKGMTTSCVCEEAQAGGDDAECAADYAAMGGGNGNMMNFLAAAGTRQYSS